MREQRGHAFTVVEVLIAIAIIALLAAVIIPTAKSQLDKSQVSAVSANLQAVREGILAYRENVGFYPSELVQLVTRPGTGGVTTNNSCGAATPAASIAKWRGPYLAQAITTSGFPSGDVTVQNSLTRTPANTSGAPEGTLAVSVSDVVNSTDESLAKDVEKAVDGYTVDTLTLSSGAIRWTVVSGVMGTMTYHISIRNC